MTFGHPSLRTIEQDGQFKRDLRREKKGRNRPVLESSFLEILRDLASDIPLAPRYRDHALSGDWKDHRECHVRPDLLLIYRLPDPDTLQLVRLGSHSELGL
jgi:mRNA interferase YafQ